jgi:hypothetical protein
VPNGVTLNDSGDTDTGPNGLLNYPVITSAVLAGGELSISGFARPGSAIELYLAAADPTGFGEGVTYLTLLGEGSGADLATTAGSYGPAAINGLAQGSDNTNRFAFRIAAPSGVSVGSRLTGTTTLGGQTSEFSGNVVVTGGPNLVHAKTVAVVEDPFNSTTNPKSIPGSVQNYTLRVTNQGTGPVDNDSLVVVDAVPVGTDLRVADLGAPGSGPVAFSNGHAEQRTELFVHRARQRTGQPRFLQRRWRDLDLRARTGRQWFRSSRHASTRAPARHDGGQHRRGRPVVRTAVPGPRRIAPPRCNAAALALASHCD